MLASYINIIIIVQVFVVIVAHLFLAASNGWVSENGNYTRGSSGATAVDPVQGSAGDGTRQRQELRIVIDANLSSPVIDSLVLQTLAIIRTLVDK